MLIQIHYNYKVYNYYATHCKLTPLLSQELVRVSKQRMIDEVEERLRKLQEDVVVTRLSYGL